MKIVVSSNGDRLESQVDARFGRCRYFVIVETEDREIKSVSAVENKGSTQAHGAGIAAAEQVGELKPEKLITGNLGPNAFRVIQQVGIEAYHASGSVRDAVIELIEGRLNRIGSDVPSHFGTR